MLTDWIRSALLKVGASPDSVSSMNRQGVLGTARKVIRVRHRQCTSHLS
jgi:hypothetical protein